MKKIMSLILCLTILVVSATAVEAAETKTKLCGQVEPNKDARITFEGGIMYDVELINVANNKAALRTLGENTGPLGSGERYQAAGLVDWTVTSISGNTVNFCVNLVPKLDDLGIIGNPLKKGQSKTVQYMNTNYAVKVESISRDKVTFKVNDKTTTLVNGKLGGNGRYKIDDQAMLFTSHVVEYKNELYADFGIGKIEYPPRTEPETESEELDETEIKGAELSRATPKACKVPTEFQDKTDTALLAFWTPGETPKWAHGKKYGKLYLEGGYWLSLKEIKDKTATIDVDGETATIKEGESKEISGVKIYMYKIGENFIDYCIHETAAQSLKFTCTQGCITEDKCLPFGSRLIEDGKPSYCSLDKKIDNQKGKDVACQNNYECTSNLCSESKCVDIEGKLGLLDRITNFLKKFFKFKG